MTPHGLSHVSRLALCTLVGVFTSVTFAGAQSGAGAPSQTEALSAAVKANPEFVEAMAKELGSTPEQAAGTAAALFSIAKSFLKPEEFEQVAKTVPGMDALLAAVPQEVGPSAEPALFPTSGFASSSSSPSFSPAPTSSATAPSSMPVNMAASSGIASAVSVLSKMGINPGMLAKALPFLSGYLKKNGGQAVGALLGQVFKTGK